MTPGDGACDAPPAHWMTLLMDAHRAALAPPTPTPRVCLQSASWGGFALSSQHEDIIQMLSGLVDVKERPNWVSNPGRFSSPPVKRHLARTWLPVPFLRLLGYRSAGLISVYASPCHPGMMHGPPSLRSVTSALLLPLAFISLL